jgi:hypothetical protein
MLFAPSHAFHETDSTPITRLVTSHSLRSHFVSTPFRPAALGVLPSTCGDVLVVDDGVQSDARARKRDTS